MNEEFINVYIEMMSNKINELIKNEVMAHSRLKIAEKTVLAFQEENRKLQAELQKLQPIINKKVLKNIVTQQQSTLVETKEQISDF
jgi:hypothetical protein